MSELNLDNRKTSDATWLRLFVYLVVNMYLVTLVTRYPFFKPDGNYGYFLLSYRYMFTPRAVVGTAYDLLRELGIGWKGFELLRIGLMFAIYNVWTYCCLRLLSCFEDRRLALLWGCFLFAYPCTFHHANMRSFFDIYLSAVCLLCVVIVMKDRFFALVPLLLGFGVLIHESLLFEYVPFVSGVIVWRHGVVSRRGWLRVGLTLFFVGCVFLFMVHHRRKLSGDPVRQAQLKEYQVSRCEFPEFVEHLRGENGTNMTYWEHCKLVWSHFFLEKYSLHQLSINVLSLVLLFPGFVVLYRLWRLAFRQALDVETRRRMAVLLVSCFGGCCMFIVAHDYVRWTTAIFICNAIALTLLYSDKSLGLRAKLSRRQVVVFAMLILFYMTLDPPNGVRLPATEFFAYPMYKLCQ